MTRLPLLPTALAALCLLPALATATERLRITVDHSLDIARPSETITVPWSAVNGALPGALLQRIEVRNAAGDVLPYQVTNVAPLSRDLKNEGIAYGELIFQHNFKAGEKTASFTVEKIDHVSPPFPTKAYARYIPERLDDFGWENDKIGHRAYGPALAAPAPPGSDKEVLVSSGIDIWFKRVAYPIVDRWYNKGHDHYHHDEGEGMDMYNVGRTRGTGGSGIWDGKTLHVARNYARWKVLANGPVRAIFELHYDAWDAGGVQVAEVKRFTVDAGHYFDRIDSTFSFSGVPQLTVGIGLNKTPTDKGQEPGITVVETPADPSLVQWVTQKTNGAFGTGLIVPAAAQLDKSYAADPSNLLILAPVKPGAPLTYYAGAGWTRSGDFNGPQDWQRYVAQAAARFQSPVKVSWTAER